MPVIETTKETIEDTVANSSKIVIVDFWAGWCQPCKMMKPVLEKLSDEYSEIVDVLKVDADAEGDVVAEYGVSSLPTLVVIKEGKEVHRIIGAKNLVSLKRELEPFI